MRFARTCGMGRPSIPRSIWCLVLALLLALTAACSSQKETETGEKPKADKPESLSKAEKAFYERAKDEVVATIAGEDITREHVLAYNAQARVAPSLSSRDIIRAKPAELKSIIDDLAITRVAAAEASLLPEANTTDALRMVREYEERFLIQTLYQKEIQSKMAEPTEKEIKEYYAKNSRDPQFTQPFHFSIRHVFVSNYVPVETQEGDTLEGLAMRISGDTRMTSMILVDNNEKSPRAPDYGSNPGIPEVQPGEFLLVPAGPEVKKANRAKIEKALERIKAGEDFAKVAAEVSGEPSKAEVIENVGLSGKMPLPQLVEAARKTPLNGISDIFETKHGYNIIQVIDKKEEGSRPLDEVRDEVQRLVRNEKQKALTEPFMRGLFRIPEFKVNFDAFRRPPASEDEVLLTLGSQTYARRDLDLPDLGEPDPKLTDEAILETLESNRELQTALLLFKAKQLGLDKSGAYLGTVDSFINGYKRSLYMDYLRNDEQRREIGMDEAKDYFEKNKSAFALPKAHTFYRLDLQVPAVSTSTTLTAPELLKQTQLRAAELTQGIQSLDEFKRIIAENGEDEISKTKQGLVENMPESEMHPELAKELQALQPGKLSVPVTAGNHVIVAWLVSTRAPREATLDDYKDNLLEAVKRQQMSNFGNETNARWLEKAAVQMR